MSNDQPSSYDPRDALTDIAASRESVAERLITPWWYHPILGALLASIVLVNALHAPTAVTLVVTLAAAAGMGALAGQYRKITGLWVDHSQAGPRARRWWSLYAVIVMLTIGLALIPALTPLIPSLTLVRYPMWAAVLLAAASLVATIAVGRRIDDGLRADIRAGDAPLPKGA